MSAIWENQALIPSGSIEYEMPNMTCRYELKVAIGQKFAKNTEIEKKKKNESSFVLFR